MGIYDRDYIRPHDRGAVRGSGPDFGGRRLPIRLAGLRVVTWLIIINVAVYVIDAILASAGVRFLDNVLGGVAVPPLYGLGYFSTNRVFFWTDLNNNVHLQFEVWRVVTFQFLHDPRNISHILLNMVGLYFIGPIVEDHLGSKRFLAFYLMCGIGGAILYGILNAAAEAGIPLPGALYVPTASPLVGASAGVFGILIAAARIAPSARILLFFVIPARLQTVAWLFIGLAAFNLFVRQGPNQGGDAAHIGGAIAGFFFIRNPHLLRDFFDVFSNSNRPARPGKPRRGRGGTSRGGGAAPPEAEIDRILDKINAHGMHSITPRERKILETRRSDT